MIDFKSVTLEDRAWAEPILFSAGTRSCENTFGVLYTWQRAYGIRIARWRDLVVGLMEGPHGSVYLNPMGAGSFEECVEALEADAAERGIPFKLVCITPEMIEQLETYRPGGFEFTADRQSFDYVYDIDKLADLGGKKLQAKRNHINRFVENHPDWTAIPVTVENIGECAEVERLWQAAEAAEAEHPVSEAADQRDENVALALALRDFGELGLEGILIRAGGKPIAFALGKQVSEESYNIHFEKADASVQGSYAIVNREYARWIRENYPTVRYINREDDMGAEGLRKAKESYHPAFLIEKYTASPKA